MCNGTLLNKPTNPKPAYLSEAVPNVDREGLGMVTQACELCVTSAWVSPELNTVLGCLTTVPGVL